MLEILRAVMNLSESWNHEIAVLKHHLEVFEGTYKGFLKYSFLILILDVKLQKKRIHKTRVK